MPLPGDDKEIIDYLLGRLPEREAERLDEMSITDSAFGSRLSATENDLVDAYVRGELSGETLERFRSFYLASPLRQEKVHFAEALLAHEKTTAALSPATETPVGSGLRQTIPERFSRQRRRKLFQLFPAWGFATAALLFVTVLLLIQNQRLNTQIRQSQADRARLTQNQQALELELQKQRAANTGTIAETKNPEGGAANTKKGAEPAARIASFVLAPALRGTDSIATIATPSGIKQIRVKLQLEAGFPRYRVTLKDPATDQVRWRSGEIRAEDAGETVSVLLSTSLLKQQNYTFELNGITDRGSLEFISSYPFRFMVK